MLLLSLAGLSEPRTQDVSSSTLSVEASVVKSSVVVVGIGASSRSPLGTLPGPCGGGGGGAGPDPRPRVFDNCGFQPHTCSDGYNILRLALLVHRVRSQSSNRAIDVEVVDLASLSRWRIPPW